MSSPLLEVVENLFHDCAAGIGNEDALPSLNELVRLARKGLIRDVDFTSNEFCGSFIKFVKAFWSTSIGQENDHVGVDKTKLEFCQKSNEAIGLITGFPEFDRVVEAKVCTLNVAQSAFQRSELAGIHSEGKLLSDYVYRCYANANSQVRGALRKLMGNYLRKSKLSSSGGFRRHSVTVTVALNVIGCIVRGFKTPLSPANRELLTQLILPLHDLPGKVSHQTPVLGLIHQPMVLCIVEFIMKEHCLMLDTLNSILKAWPSSWAGNTPKEILLIHELEAILESDGAYILLEEENSAIRNMTLVRLATSISSDHSIVCERTLILWKSEKVVKLLAACQDELLPAILKPLLLKSLVHWNATAVRMTVNILRMYLEDTKTSDQLVLAANRIWNEAEAPEIPATIPETRSRLELLVNEHHVAQIEAETQSVIKDSSGNVVDDFQTYLPPKLADAGVMNMVFGHELGVGSFGKVYYALKVSKHMPRSKWSIYAVKEINKKYKDLALREAEMMDLVSHPNCTRLISMYETSGSINLVLEYAENGDLHSILSKLGSLDVESSRFIAGEVASGLGAVHLAGLIFGDLKPENVLIHGNGHAKLGDFGSTRKASKTGKGARMEGTLIYLAPEVSRGETVTRASDWWAFGCLIYQMISGRPPLWIGDEQRLREKLVNFKIETFPAGFAPSAEDIVLLLLDRDLNTRLGSGEQDYKEVESRPFFSEKEFNLDTLYMKKAPKFSTGKVRPAEGPWTQRTYSMMISPLPKKYETQKSFAASVIPESTAECSLPWTHTGGYDEEIVQETSGFSQPLEKNRKDHFPIPVREDVQKSKKLGLPPRKHQSASAAHATAAYLLAKGGGAHLLQNQAVRTGRPARTKMRTNMPKPLNLSMGKKSQRKKADKRSSFTEVDLDTTPIATLKSNDEKGEDTDSKSKYNFSGVDLTAG